MVLTKFIYKGEGVKFQAARTTRAIVTLSSLAG